MEKLLILLLTVFASSAMQAQSGNCVFKAPFTTIHFGTGEVRDLNTSSIVHYGRVDNPCPTDGHYAYINSTSGCFRGDWFDLTEDHTPRDRDGNMMLVNASYYVGPFLSTTVSGFKGNTTYEFGVWMMNVCRISDKCPYPLLPNITIRLQTQEGKVVAQFQTGEVQRVQSPKWRFYRAVFTTPAAVRSLKLTMIDQAPGGCGNDFVLDDITFKECIRETPVVKAQPKAEKATTKTPVKKQEKVTVVKISPKAPLSEKPPVDANRPAISVASPSLVTFPPPPPALTNRSNPLIKKIETEPGEIRISLYDNGVIDGDTITVYHNNELVVSHAGLSAKPISFRINVDPAHPHHELVMVADNLGSIVPNTSLMIVSAGDKRYEVFISSTEQKNAKVVIDMAKGE